MRPRHRVMPHARGPFPAPPALGSRTFILEAHLEFMSSSMLIYSHLVLILTGGGEGWWSRESSGRTCIQLHVTYISKAVSTQGCVHCRVLFMLTKGIKGNIRQEPLLFPFFHPPWHLVAACRRLRVCACATPGRVAPG